MKQDRDLDDLVDRFINKCCALGLPVSPFPINRYFPLEENETHLTAAQIGYDLAIAAKGRDVWYSQDRGSDRTFFFIGSLEEVKASVKKGMDGLLVQELMES